MLCYCVSRNKYRKLNHLLEYCLSPVIYGGDIEIIRLLKLHASWSIITC